jgi:hypothetical protein
MTNQIQGEILFAGVTAVYTPWMPVRGDIATFGVEIEQISNTTLKWSVQTRTTEDPNPTNYGEPVATETDSALAVHLKLSSSTAANLCQELVRYKFETTGTASAANFVVFRALQPSWQVDR